MKRDDLMKIFFILSFIGLMIYFFWSIFLLLLKEKQIDTDTEITECYHIFLLIPMLNEKEVIQSTIEFLSKQIYSSKTVLTLIPIDDGSDDGTTEIIAKLSQEFFGIVEPVFRKKPNAQKGKGEALNAGLLKIKYLVRQQNLNTEKVLVGILDADALIFRNSLEEVIKVYEEDKELTMVQTVVGMNHTSKWLHRMQDLEFQTCNYLIQNSRNYFSNSAASGNGQFFRLSKLETYEKLWGNSLLEDFEFSTRILLNGLKTIFLSSASVYQEPVSDVQSFWKQRARWAQGGIQCLPKYGKQILISKKIKRRAKIEMFFYMLLPYITAITFVGHLVSMLYQVHQILFLKKEISFVLLIYFLLSILISIILGSKYSKRTKKNKVHGVLLGLTVPLYNILLIPSTYLAIFRHILGKIDWEKTTHENLFDKPQ